MFCTAANCAAGCIAFEFEDLPEDECFIPTGATPYNSAFLSDPSDEVIPFLIGGGDDCSELAILPAANECFNISPPGEFFAVFP